MEREGGRKDREGFSSLFFKSLNTVFQNQNTERQSFLEHVYIIETYCSLVHF